MKENIWIELMTVDYLTIEGSPDQLHRMLGLGMTTLGVKHGSAVFAMMR
jgi:hypothetical protein